MFRNIRLEKSVQCSSKKTPFKHVSVYSEPVSLFEADVMDHSLHKQQFLADQLDDLIRFDEGVGVLEANVSSHRSETDDPSEGSCCKIDDMISANLLDFGNQPRKRPVHRRPMRADGL